MLVANSVLVCRDLKPDNMLLTNDWQLKLTGFGEARAVDLNQTVTSVGTPIYVAPEVTRGDSYGTTCDSYSFVICLVAMIRGEKDVQEYYFQALRKKMKRKTKAGVGVAILSNRKYSQNWRPLLPMEFESSFRNLTKLIKDCWSNDQERRPNFDEIVKQLTGAIANEVRSAKEPALVFLSDEPDELYWAREQEEKEGVGKEVEEKEKVLPPENANVPRKEYERVLLELKELQKKLISDVNTQKFV